MSAAARESRLAWIPSLDVVWVRRESVPAAGGEPTQWLEARVHAPIGSGPARGLVVSHRGDVHDGEVHDLAGGGLRFDLDGWARGHVVRREGHLALDAVGPLRQRVWSIVGAERSLGCDLALRRLVQERDGDVQPPARRSGS